MIHHYHVFGLHLASELELPELSPAAPLAAADCRIAVAAVEKPAAGEAPSASWLHPAPGVYQIDMPDARFRIEHGRRIVVDPLPSKAPGDVRLWLLGTALAVLLHQRGHLPLHASAVLIDGEVHAFCGASGAGKSTLAMALGRRGIEVLTDDVGVVMPEGNGRWLFHAGVPRVKLWRESLEHFGIAHQGLIRDQTRSDKYHLQLPAAHGPDALPAHPVGRIHILDRSEDGASRIETLRGHAAIEQIRRNVYRQRTAHRLGRSAALLGLCGRLVGDVPVCRFIRPWQLESLEEALEVLLGGLPEAGPPRRRRAQETG